MAEPQLPLAQTDQPAAALPGVDDLLGPAPTGTSVDDILGPAPPQSRMAAAGAAIDHFLSAPGNAIGRTLSAFGQGAANAWGTDRLGLSDENAAALQTAGVLPDVQKGQGGLLRSFNEALIRPAAVAVDASLRALNAGFGGAQAAAEQAGIEVGSPALGRDVAAIPEAFMGTPHPFGGPVEAGAAAEAGAATASEAAATAHAPPSLASARDLNVIGPGGEAAWKGTVEAAAPPESVVADQVKEQQAAAASSAAGAVPLGQEAPAAQMGGTVPAAADIHMLAVQMAPEAFTKYGFLEQTRDNLRAQLDAMRSVVLDDHAAQAPGAAEIADLRARMEDATPRLAKKYQARLDALLPEHDAFLDANAPPGDTPEMADLRQRLQRVDYSMRDLAPEISGAYREAAKQFPEPEAADEPAGGAEPSAPVESPAAQEEPPAVSTATPTDPAASPATPQTDGTAPPPEARAGADAANTPMDIAADVSRKMQAAGRPAEEADAAGQVTQALWNTRAQAFGGAKGSAAEMYAAEGADIRPGRDIRARRAEYAQHGTPSVVLRGDELGDLTGSGARDAARAEFRRQKALGPVQNGDLGEIRFSGQSEGKTLFRADAGKLQLIPKLREIIADGRLLRSDADYRGRQSVKAYHTLETVVRVGNRDMLVHTTVREDVNGKFYYDVQKGDGAPAAETAPGGASPVSSTQEGVLSPGALSGPPLPKTFEQNSRSGDGFNLEIMSARRGGAAGKIRLTEDGRAVITLMRNADASTFLHEMGHDWLERMMRDASDPDAPQHMRDDAVAVRSYLGVEDGEAIPTRAHEKFARSFERYFMEGRAPSQRLAGVFAQFKGWLTGIYQTVAKLRAPITDDIRDVFDRLLSTPDERAAIAPEFPDTPSQPETIAQDSNAAKAVSSDLASLHEDDLQRIRPTKAGGAADQIRQEIDHTAEKHAPEVADEFDGSGSGAGGSAAADGDFAGDDRPAGDGPGSGGDLQEPAAIDGGGSGAAAEGDRVSADTSRTEPPASANAVFQRPDGGLIDKAGNIRLDNLGTPQDVAQVIREAAGQNDDFTAARRGVISDSQVSSLADALGMDAKSLSARKLGQAFNAEEVLAARRLLVQSATEVRDLMRRAAEGGEADLIAYAKGKARHQMIQEQVAGLTAEAGRALRAFRSLEGEADAKAFGQFLQQNTGRDLFQLRREAQMGMALDTPQQVSKFLNDAKKSSFLDKMLEYWTNGLISGPATHVTYSVGNTLSAIWRAGPETGAAALVGKVRQALGNDGPRVMPGEVQAQFFGMVQGVRDGVFAAGKAARTGLTTELPGEAAADMALQSRAIPGKLGEVIRLPSRGVGMIHSFFRAIGYSQAKSALAYRMAAEEGLSGDAFAARVADLSMNPPEAMMEEARNAASEQTLMGQGGALTEALTNLTSKVPLLKFVMPFVKIGSNITSQALLERTPLGIFDSGVRNNLLGRAGKIAQDQQIARIAVGTAVASAAVMLAQQGYLTGSGPSDPREAALWRLSGKQPYSVRIGDTWYGVHRLGPLAVILGIGADMSELGDQMQTHDLDQVGGLMVGSIAKNLLDESWMKGPSDLIQAVTDHERYGAKYVRQQLSSFVPFSVGMGQIAAATDPYQREARTMLDAIRAKAPGLSEQVAPRLDVWGQPMPGREVLGVPGLSAITATHNSADPVTQAMARADYMPAPIERKVRGVALADRQYQSLASSAGVLAKQRLDQLVNMPGFAALPPALQHSTMRGIVENSREAARTLLLMQNPTIVQQAVRAKQASLYGR